MTLYEEVKEFIKFGLNKEYSEKNGILASNSIETQINIVKKIIETSETRQWVSKDMHSIMTDDDWKNIKKELEAHYNVKMDEGSIIKGEEQQLRDTTWWSNKTKQEQEKNKQNYYWDRFKKYNQKKLPLEVIKITDIDTDVIMDNIGNPSDKEFDIYGMSVGHVQSGKTTNYLSLICKAADAGYKFIVVIAGDKNNLRNQTQARLSEGFIGKNSSKSIGVGLEDNTTSKIPVSLTSMDNDFDIKIANANSQGLNFDNINTPILLVIKKNSSVLSNVISWIKSQDKHNISKHAMLIIDDESDYASINTKEVEDPTAINKKIRALASHFKKSSYVAYTATPYANIFIDYKANELKDVHIDNKNKNKDLSKDLFPSDFIYALDAPTNYFGARKIFIEDLDKYISHINDYQEIIPTNHKKDYELTHLPNSLYEAINLFILNVSIRNLRKQESSHNSMLIHITRFSDIHLKIALLVDKYLEEIKKEIKVYGKLDRAETYSDILLKFHKIFKEKLNFIEFSWQDVLSKVVDIIDTILIREEHQKSKLRIEYRKDTVSNIIAIGGMSLSRGFTLEGLSVSYFIRSTIFYDTLMQMGRWFGYRDGYEDLCKIYMPLEISTHFTQIIEATEKLMSSFKEMAKENKTPLDFGLAVRQHPDSLLQVTAKNKRKNTKILPLQINLNGMLKEITRFDINTKIHQNNFKIFTNFLDKINNKLVKNEKSYIYQNIVGSIIEEFLTDFKIFKKSAIDNMMPVDFICDYIKKFDYLWDVILYSGKSDEVKFEKFSINAELRSKYQNLGHYIEIGQRKISTGNAEISIFGDEEASFIKKKEFKKGEKTKFIRKQLKKPILMLHILDVAGFCNCLPAFGVVFPDNGLGDSQTIEYVINPVYINALEERIRYEDESDD